MALEITSLQIGEIKLPEKSLKEHPKKQIRQIADSIEAFGFNDPVAIDENHEIIEGVGRVLAAQELGLKDIPVISLKHLNAAQKKAYRIAHNKICQNSDFNLEALRLEFEAISQMNESLLAWSGFETAEIDDLMRLPVLPDLDKELTEAMKQGNTVTCPHCGGSVYV
ncbi:MAG: chromosome partitioning protein ParB [Vampirovibrio sp.]|jgi:ParB-like chromosome segregation protein Spo0J|nr:chromosome partitioning protein ParB [Vampirovibrio sp.]